MLVFGSLPPGGRDIDLLARPAEEVALEQALAEEGFLAKGDRFARFRACAAEAVEVVPAATWQLPEAALDELYADAVPLPGADHLVAAAPQHAVLILARRLGRRGLAAKHRARLEEELARDPAAWSKAHARAADWGVEEKLGLLEQAWREPARSWVPPRPRRGHVVSFSGLDGSGKSTQAQALRAALEQLGHDVVIIWTPLGSNATLRALAAPARLALALARRAGLGGAAAARSAKGESLVALPDAGEGGRGQTVLALGWSAVVATTNALSQASRAAPHLAVGRIVIFDRYVLDSAVHLRYLYGEGHGFSLQERLLRLISPRPLAAFYLDADADTVLARKPLQYDIEQLRAQAALYRAHAARLRVAQLDSTRPREELCAEIAETVWRRLG